MRSLLILLLLIFSNYYLIGSCASSGLYTWPESEFIQSEGIIMIEGYARSQEIITGLGEKYPIYLKSGENKVQLIVTELCKGEMRLTQAILKPISPLRENQEYELIIEDIPEKFFPLRSRGPYISYNKEKKISKLVKWTCAKKKDIVRPKWDLFPQKPTIELIQWGCGPEYYYHFPTIISDDSEVLIKTTVILKDRGEQSCYYLKYDPEESKISVGHGMCSGAFKFLFEGKYEIFFQLVDLGGNESNYTTRKYSVEEKY